MHIIIIIIIIITTTTTWQIFWNGDITRNV
jgi:hypothetical protein